MDFSKYVKINSTSLDCAIKSAQNPMTQWFDPKHDDLPYFANIVTQNGFGNFHHTSWSGGHCPGRWAETLYFSQLVTGMELDVGTYKKLKKWIYKVYDNQLHLPADIDLESFALKKEVDLCNLRESFFGLTTVFLHEHDYKAFLIAEDVIETVNKYFDFEAGVWNAEQYELDTGAKSVGLFTEDWETIRFCNTFGRFIGGLVRYYQASSSPAALTLALKLADVALRTIVLEDGSFDPERTAQHCYSTTSVLSGIALLAHLTGDMFLFGRLQAFMENGFYDIALETGWSTENTGRNDWVGEINNSSDFLEVCLFLGNAGYSEYYERAERMLRGHILPAQLLDPCFIPNEENADDAKHYMADRVKGAFGFPTPYGHEDSPGTQISYNWDIIGGTSGICWAKTYQVTEENDIYSINLLFDYENHQLKVTSPYGNNNVISLKLRVNKKVRIRLSSRIDREELLAILKDKGYEHCILGNWLYLNHLPVGSTCAFQIPFTEEEKTYEFNHQKLTFKWLGDSVTAASSPGKRLCFFPELIKS